MFIFMFHTGQAAIITVFQSRFKIIHTYLTYSREGKQNEKYFKLNQAKSSIPSRLWNKVLWSEEKHILSEYLFKKKTKEEKFAVAK